MKNVNQFRLVVTVVIIVLEIDVVLDQIAGILTKICQFLVVRIAIAVAVVTHAFG